MAIFGFGKPKVGLALGGGGSKGFAHIGVIKALTEMNFVPDLIAGTSAGAIAGALWASGKTYEEMIELMAKVSMKAVKTSKIPFVPNKTSAVEELVADLLGGDINFEDLKIPLIVVAVDVKTGAEVHIKSGSVAKAVSASCAYPGAFTTVEIGDYVLFDGGLLNSIPANVPKLYGCVNTIGVDINPGRGEGTDSKKYLNQLAAAFRIAIKSNSLKGYLNADVMIQAHTKNVKALKSIKKDASRELVGIGYEATLAKREEIEKVLSTKNYLDKKNKKNKPAN